MIRLHPQPALSSFLVLPYISLSALPYYYFLCLPSAGIKDVESQLLGTPLCVLLLFQKGSVLYSPGQPRTNRDTSASVSRISVFEISDVSRTNRDTSAHPRSLVSQVCTLIFTQALLVKNVTKILLHFKICKSINAIHSIHRLKHKTNMLISLDKKQHPSIIKVLEILWIQGQTCT